MTSHGRWVQVRLALGAAAIVLHGASVAGAAGPAFFGPYLDGGGSRAYVVNAILGSGEYRARFLP